MREKILATLAYADIFDYPLTLKEIFRFLITSQKIKEEEIKKAIRTLLKEGKIGKMGRFYFLKGREEIVFLRKKRQKESNLKIKKAEKISKYLRFLPLIKMVALTGNLAVKNSSESDDIDFLIVTKKGWLWTGRFLTTVLLEILGCRRRPGDKKFKDKICLNMFWDEGYLSLPSSWRNLFTAHEICQIEPLWQKDDVYFKFLFKNRWVKKYLANFELEKKNIFFEENKNKPPFSLVEKILKKVQLYYMQKRRTKEKITSGIIAFHPRDLSPDILEKYQKRLKLLGL